MTLFLFRCLSITLDHFWQSLTEWPYFIVFWQNFDIVVKKKAKFGFQRYLSGVDPYFSMVFTELPLFWRKYLSERPLVSSLRSDNLLHCEVGALTPPHTHTHTADNYPEMISTKKIISTVLCFVLSSLLLFWSVCLFVCLFVCVRQTFIYSFLYNLWFLNGLNNGDI